MSLTSARDLIASAQRVSAAAGTWAKSEFLETLCAELGEAVIGHPSAPGSGTTVIFPPTRDAGASFENDVFALRAYCWCNGDVHGRDPFGLEACPANFELFRDGESAIRGEWFACLGKGTVFTGIPSPDEYGGIRDACLRSLQY